MLEKLASGGDVVTWRNENAHCEVDLFHHAQRLDHHVDLFPWAMASMAKSNGRCALHGEGLAGAGLPIGKQTAVVSCQGCGIAIEKTLC